MGIKEKTLLLFEDSCKNTGRGLITICEAEKYLQQAYNGRYFFELIQNVRDANKEALQDGDIYIKLDNNILSIANTGAPFSEEGIASITSIGQSTKKSLEYIGFKGIGFKSTLEVSDTPSIITTEGSVYFDRRLTVEVLKKQGNYLLENQVPLFFFPHYREKGLTEEEKEKGIVTKIELPVKDSFYEERIYRDFNKIQVKQLVLLGNIRKVDFMSPTQRIIYNIRKDITKNHIEVDNGNEVLNKFRFYVPTEKIYIPDDILKTLEGKEKEIYSNCTSIDIHIALELNEKNQFVPDDDAKLYLFYPLDVHSGFRFIIHSYFLVNPERTQLRNSPLNNYLFRKIGEYIGSEMLQQLKKGKYNTNEILRFVKQQGDDIKELYDGLVETLLTQKFIYDQHSRKYYRRSEVIIADGFDKGLFPDNRFDDKPIVYIENRETVEWLRDEFNVSYLNYEEIANNIEHECKRQAKRKNLGFFRNLYKYIDLHENLNVSGKKILLTNNWKLISDHEDVFYGGRRNPISLPDSIQKYIHFVHNEIKLDVRETRIGVKEFNTNELIRRLLKLFDESNVPNNDILNAIYHLAPQDVRSELDIKEKILLPVKDQDEWISPLKHPVYFDTDELRELYPDGYFVDKTILIQNNVEREVEDEKEINVNNFLKLCGVWDIPAFYISDDEQTTSNATGNIRVKHIRRYSHLFDAPFYIENDRMLHKPVKYTKWFTDTLVENWEFYKSYMNSAWFPKLKYSNGFSKQYAAEAYAVMKFSSFCEDLSRERWILLNEGERGYSPAYVVGSLQLTHNNALHKYLRLFPIDYEINYDIIQSIGLCHLNGNSADNFAQLLKHIYNRYHIDIPKEKDFIDFYNHILNIVSDFYDKNELTDAQVKTICATRMLSINEIDGQPGWELPANIYYIDDKTHYDLLPESIKSKIQPHFTKRDRNTFGKIAAKVGKRFSSSITKKLVDAPVLKKIPLTDFFIELPKAITLLEYNFEIAMSSYLETIKLVEVCKKEKIQTEVLIDGSPCIIIESDYFIEKTRKSFILHIKDSHPEQSKLIAGCLAELFRNILDRDLKRFDVDLWKFIIAPDKIRHLTDYDIPLDRVEEIKQELYASDFNQKQKFWQAIYIIKKIHGFESIVKNETVDAEKISLSIGLDTETVQKINDGVNFDDINNPQNILLLSLLIQNLNISFSQINQYIYPEVNFRSYYQKLLEREKNKFQNKFMFILYQATNKLSLAEQSAFGGWVQKYINDFHPTVPAHVDLLDIKTHFIKCLNEFYPASGFTLADLDTKVLFDLKYFHQKNLDTLISLLSDTDYSQEEFTLFIEDEKRQSLLYFDHTKRLAAEMKKWLVKQRLNAPNAEPQISPEQTAMKYANQRKPPVEIITPMHTPGRIQSIDRKHVTGSSTNRYDGQRSNQQKQTIGMVAEMVVYEILLEDKNIENVKWASKYAARIHPSHPGHNPDGTDGLGYDIEYTDKEGNKYFIEVKGKADNVNCFEITTQEIAKAQLEKEFYQVYFVTNTLNEISRRIKNIGNPFIFEEGENFFNNKRFSAVTKSYEIRFRE